MKKIVFIGNPNVGKSVLFSRLTGIKVMVSNYPGTTVEFLEGYVNINNERCQVIDLPGTYSLQATSPAEEVAVKILKDADIVVNVIDATNLERNLYLTSELLETDHPLVIALNIYDEIKHKGVEIDVEKLQEILKVPVIPTSGITGYGIKNLKENLNRARVSADGKRTPESRWTFIGTVIEQVQRLHHRHHTILERLEDATVNHFWGLVIAGLAIALSFKFVRFVGEGLINYVLDPLFNTLYMPLIQKLSVFLGGKGILHTLLIGKMVNGGINFEQSLGMLTTAPYVEFVMVLPYVLAFYVLLSFLEDSGYIPRLALLLDNVMHKLGLHGFAIIPVLLGFGCNVPGILGTRILDSKRERFIASTLISIAVPCAALQAMIVGMLGKSGGQYVVLVYFVLFCVWLFIGTLLNLLLKGYSPELFLEIPSYRIPNAKLLTKKVLFRIKGFIIEALPIVLLSVLAINILQQVRVFNFIAGIFSPLLKTVFGLPKEAIWPLVIGFLRKDIAAGMLIPLNLSAKQMVISCVVLSMSFPCLATFVVFLKELGAKRLMQALGIIISMSLAVGGLLNLLM